MSSRTPPAALSPACPHPRPGRGQGGRCRTIALLLVAIAVTVPCARADRGDLDEARGGAIPGSRKQYTRIENAWKGRDAGGVIAMVAPRGLLKLSLRTTRISGTYRRAQAQKTLQGYFRNVSSVQLKDVTRPLQPLPYGYNVRTYDYTYAPRGRDRVTTHLVITLKLYGRTEWKLDSIVEKPRPPSGPR